MCGLLALSASGGSAAARAGASQARAIEAPGALNSISCAAVGECAAGGYFIEGYTPYDKRLGYYRQRYRRDAFVVSEVNGSWGKPVPVPTSGVGSAEVISISCPAIGDCAAGGYFYARRGGQGFVVSEKNGTWGKAVEVPGLATLNRRGDASVTSISCAATGNCAAGGYYWDRHYNRHAFVVSETNGAWGTAIKVPGTATLNAGGDAEVTSISCAAPGECAAGGSYSDSARNGHAFVVSQTNGIWSKATEVPGTAALNTGGEARLMSISCPAAGECGAGGFYAEGSGKFQAFVVGETNHTWGDAIEVPGTATLNHAGDAGADSISCPAPGECAASGHFTLGSARGGAFVVSETNGTWGTAIEVPGMGTLSRDASIDSISCAAPGECSVGGDYKQPRSENDGHYGLAFVASETNGTWGSAITVPGTASLNGTTRGGFPAASADSISCAAPGECAAGGYWFTGSAALHPRNRRPRAFVLDETSGSWGAPMRVRNHLTRCEVPSVLFRDLTVAKIRLNGFGCRLGTITRADSSVWKGRVIAQRPGLGTTLRVGARVAVTVSKGS